VRLERPRRGHDRGEFRITQTNWRHDQI
jgi:hypothetical protein